MRNWFDDFKEVIEIYLRNLEFTLNKTSSKAKRDIRKRDSIILYFGIEGKRYSREEISIILEITIERVRQILKKGVTEIAESIFENQDSGLFAKSHDSIKEMTQRLKSEKVISYNSFLCYCSKALNQEVEVIRPIIDLMIEVFGFKKIRIHLHYLKDNDLIITSNEIDKRGFIKLCQASYLAVERNVVPISSIDLIISLKRKLKDNIKNSDIFLACKVVDSISIEGNNKRFHIDFDRLSSIHDMAYRILFEKGKRMKLAAILKEINFRLIGSDRRRVGKTSLNSQMNMDSRLVPLGKSSYWTLKEWNELNKTMYDLITETLTLFNKPLLKKQIFEHIQKSRPNIPTFLLVH